MISCLKMFHFCDITVLCFHWKLKKATHKPCGTTEDVMTRRILSRNYSSPIRVNENQTSEYSECMSLCRKQKKQHKEDVPLKCGTVKSLFSYNVDLQLAMEVSTERYLEYINIVCRQTTNLGLSAGTRGDSFLFIPSLQCFLSVVPCK